MALTVPSLPSLRPAPEQVGNCLSVVTWPLSIGTYTLFCGSGYRLASIWSESSYLRVGVATRHRSVKCSIRLLNIVDAKRSETLLSQKRHANRVRRYNQRKRKRLTLVVILSALLSCASERSVWTLSRNDWWARNAGDTIDIGAWPSAGQTPCSWQISECRRQRLCCYLLAGLLGFARDSCIFSLQIWYFPQCWPHIELQTQPPLGFCPS